MDFCIQWCLIAFYKIHLKSYSMAFNDNYLTKSSNIFLLVKKETNTQVNSPT